MTEIDKSRIKKNKVFCFLSPEIEYDNFGLLQFRTVNVGNHFLFSSLLRMFLIRKHDVRTLHSERRS